MRTVNKWIPCQDCFVKRVPGGMIVSAQHEAIATAPVFIPCAPEVFIKFLEAHDINVEAFTLEVGVPQGIATPKLVT